jgi:hypothetical protein
MARRMTKRYITKDDIVDVLVDRTHEVLLDDVSIYSVHEFNRTLVELVVKECGDLVRKELLMFTDPTKFTGKVLLEETLYKHFNMEVRHNESNS